MEKNRRIKNIFIIVLLVCMCCLSIGYSLFSQFLNIEGVTEVTSQSTSFRIVFGDVETSSVTGYATGNSSLDSTERTITFSCEFISPGDSCEISANIYNKGIINTLYSSSTLTVLKDGTDMGASSKSYDDGIIWVQFTEPSNWTEGSTVLKANDSGSFNVKATLNSNSSLSSAVKYTVSVTFDFEQAPNE